MSLTKFTGATNNVQGLADKPTLSASDLKAKFDKTGADLKDYINNTLIPEIDDLTVESTDRYATVYKHLGSIVFNKVGKILSMKLDIVLGYGITVDSGEVIAKIDYYNTPRYNPYFICPLYKEECLFTLCVIRILQNGDIQIYSLDGSNFSATDNLSLNTEILYMLH